MPRSLTLEPIGVLHTPYRERVEAPRQPYAARDVPGTIELLPGRGFEHALEDLAAWDHIWVIFWFDRNEGWRPKVLPPRSTKRRGVFATRSPHRPSPIGLSVVRLDAIDGLRLSIRDVDMLDGTPVLDIKPYVPVADCVPSASTGWLDLDEPPPPGPVAPRPEAEPAFEVTWSEAARDAARWLDGAGVPIAASIERALALGPNPHPYRRIRPHPDGRGMQLAVKEWRVRFRLEGRRVVVEEIASGYRARELAVGEGPALDLHRAFTRRR